MMHFTQSRQSRKESDPFKQQYIFIKFCGKTPVTVKKECCEA